MLDILSHSTAAYNIAGVECIQRLLGPSSTIHYYYDIDDTDIRSTVRTCSLSYVRPTLLP